MKLSESKYAKVGVDVRKKGIEIFKSSIQSLYPTAFCVIKQDQKFPDNALVPHTDSAGSKPVQSYLNFKETKDINAFRGIAQDVVAMNIDDIACVGAKPITFVDCVSINKSMVPKEDFLGVLNFEIVELIEILRANGVTLPFDGGETADVPDQVKTLDVSGFMQGRVQLSKIVTGERIRAGNRIIGIRSGGKARYERRMNSGIMCNGMTLARHSLLSSEYTKKYPETLGSGTLGYFGRFKVNDRVKELDMTVGEAICSPTRIFAPIVFKILDRFGSSVTGLIHNTGGGQTKCLSLGRGIRYAKRDIPQPDPIFSLIQNESEESWRDMFQDYNMGIGFEIVLEAEAAEPVLSIIESFEVEASVVGEIESNPSSNQVVIESNFGKFVYESLQ
jgi:phosphoribosylformylglycinamidine cyclo-ligase